MKAGSHCTAINCEHEGKEEERGMCYVHVDTNPALNLWLKRKNEGKPVGRYPVWDCPYYNGPNGF